MKKTKIFQDAFSDVLKPHGFIYKNRTFIRVIGENIVQSLYLEASSPMYSFELNLAPAATMAIKHGRMFFEATMKKEFRGALKLNFNNFSEFPYVEYIEDGYNIALKNGVSKDITYFPAEYIEGKEVEKCIVNMQKAAELFVKLYIPILDAVTDFDSYIVFTENYLQDESLFSGKLKPSLNWLELAYKAYCDASSGYGVEYLRKSTIDKAVRILKNEFVDWEKYDIAQYYKQREESDMELVQMFGFDEENVVRFSPQCIEKALEEAKCAIESIPEQEEQLYKPFWDCVYTNDFNDIARQWAEEEKFVLDLIKEAFPKIVLP